MFPGFVCEEHFACYHFFLNDALSVESGAAFLVTVQCVWIGIDIDILAVMCRRSESHPGTLYLFHWGSIPDCVIRIFP